MNNRKRPATSNQKPALSVQEMAALVGLSRSRFYALIRQGIFPLPLFEMLKNRAVYIEPWQQVCIEARHSGRGINGQSIRFRFNEPDLSSAPVSPPASVRKAKALITKLGR